MNNNTLIYELKDLKKVSGQRTILQIKKLQIHKGTIYGIIGPVGSGKSSLLKQLAGLEKPTEGSILYDDNEFKTSMFGKLLAPKDVKFVSLLEPLRGNLVSDVFREIYGKRSQDIQNQYFNTGIRRFMWDQSIDSLSVGEQNWLKLIDAVESDPRVLIIEYCGTILDEELYKDINHRLKKMNKNLGTTIILSSLDQSKIQRLASVMIFLDKGHVSKIRSSGQRRTQRGSHKQRRGRGQPKPRSQNQRRK